MQYYIDIVNTKRETAPCVGTAALSRHFWIIHSAGFTISKYHVIENGRFEQCRDELVRPASVCYSFLGRA